jgi:hypothetical protein
VNAFSGIIEKEEKEGEALQVLGYMKNAAKASPNITATIMAIITKNITASMAIASALSQPVSKKCLINPSRIISSIIDAIMPEPKK